MLYYTLIRVRNIIYFELELLQLRRNEVLHFDFILTGLSRVQRRGG